MMWNGEAASGAMSVAVVSSVGRLLTRLDARLTPEHCREIAARLGRPDLASLGEELQAAADEASRRGLVRMTVAESVRPVFSDPQLGARLRAIQTSYR